MEKNADLNMQNLKNLLILFCENVIFQEKEAWYGATLLNFHGSPGQDRYKIRPLPAQQNQLEFQASRRNWGKGRWQNDHAPSAHQVERSRIEFLIHKRRQHLFYRQQLIRCRVEIS
nr:hypothetical protein [uncultured Fibrobacter sp.]